MTGRAQRTKSSKRGPPSSMYAPMTRVISSRQATFERRIDLELGKEPQAAVGIEGATRGMKTGVRRQRPQPSLPKLKFMEGDGS